MTFDPASTDLNILPRSRVERAGVEYGLVRGPAGAHLVILSGASIQPPAGFSGEWSEQGGRRLQICPLTPANAAALRKHLPWLQPRPLGLKTSAGLGDRLGLATPGHVRAVRAVGGNIHPIFSQQSIRENTRTGRNPQQVLDDATWGAFSEGWQGDLGADADHLKTPADIDQCLAAGYSFFTIDPGEHVNNLAEISSLNDLNQMAEHLPAEIRPQASGLLGKTFKIEDLLLHFDEAVLLKAAVKYGRAVLHVAGMYRHLVQSAGAFPVELEVSVDETDLPTSHAEHVYIASELTRLGVKWVSLAPRYVGRFEKGVDYIGDLNLFEADFAGHAAIARHFGPYKLSLHSGSDKFSIYPIASRLTQGLVHLKTAGTSYLEALRCLAGLDEGLFREIYTFARDRYPSDRASYHVSADLSRAPAPEEGMDWPGILNQFDAREILHVTFGSVLTQTAPDGKKLFFDRLMGFLAAHPDEYASALEKHFIRHLTPFVQPGLAPQP
jgi:tagaturonate epimerase